jgi:hypothetical protein
MLIQNTSTVLSAALALFGGGFALFIIRQRRLKNPKEEAAAFRSVCDRVEMLKRVAFDSLSNRKYLQSILVRPPNGLAFYRNATEIVRLTAHPVANGVTQFTRKPDGKVAIDATAKSLGNTFIQIEVLALWKEHGYEHSRQRLGIVSNPQSFRPIARAATLRNPRLPQRFSPTLRTAPGPA